MSYLEDVFLFPNERRTTPLFSWCDDSSPNAIEFLEMASETLVAMVIVNSSESDIVLL